MSRLEGVKPDDLVPFSRAQDPGALGLGGLGFRVHLGYLGIMEKKMETTIGYWGYSGIMEKKMEATIVCWLWGLGFRV